VGYCVRGKKDKTHIFKFSGNQMLQKEILCFNVLIINSNIDIKRTINCSEDGVV
jgi:hypothetical protein